MNRVDLSARGWVHSSGSHVRGEAHLDDRFLDARELARALDACTTDADWIGTVRRLNGCFAAVSAREDRLLAVVDRTRSIPLFYTNEEGGGHVSDNASRLVPKEDAATLDATVDQEFRLTGYVTGAQTLHPRVFQVEAGQAVVFDPSHPRAQERVRYHEFRHRDFFAKSSDLVSQLEAVHENVFRRLQRSTEGRTLALPLSGGYDSRLIAVALRDLGARDVVCYSYGVPGNWESRISSEVAHYLGFRWEFVAYSAERWRAWAATDRFDAYFRTAGNLASAPHIQDWPAVLELQREWRVPPDTVFVPGHSGDFLAGSHIPKTFAGRSALARREVLDALLNAHYSLWDWPSGMRTELRSEFDRRIEAVIGPIVDGTAEQAADAFERWDLQERQAKFICNSVRVYEDFGFEWRLPLFDHQLMDFWARVPLELRIGRQLYFEFVRLRQALPVTAPNTDRGALAQALVGAIDRFGLRSAAKEVQRVVRRRRWRHVYAHSSLAWPALVDRDAFRSSYTGRELMHSYLALKYRDEVVRAIGMANRKPLTR
jgi:asparagine synthase (glutamine-hydrolysing)